MYSFDILLNYVIITAPAKYFYSSKRNLDMQVVDCEKLHF